MIAAILDYDAIRAVLGITKPAQSGVTQVSMSDRLFAVLHLPIKVVQNPLRFGWGRPGPTGWCRGLITEKRRWHFPVVNGRATMEELPMRWCLRYPDGTSEEFASFDDVITLLENNEDARQRALC